MPQILLSKRCFWSCNLKIKEYTFAFLREFFLAKTIGSIFAIYSLFTAHAVLCVEPRDMSSFDISSFHRVFFSLGCVSNVSFLLSLSNCFSRKPLVGLWPSIVPSKASVLVNLGEKQKLF